MLDIMIVIVLKTEVTGHFRDGGLEKSDNATMHTASILNLRHIVRDGLTWPNRRIDH